MAKQLGFTDFASFDPTVLPPAARGITCYFCHNVDRVTSTHDNGLVLANDQTMRGGAKDPVDTPAHHSKYDERMDSDLNQSEICGSCHDIVVPASLNGTRDVELERTFAEWKQTFFSSSDNPSLKATCGACHMIGSRLEAIADAPGVKARDYGFHSHDFPGIDVALTPFPQQAEQLAAVHGILDPAIKIVGPRPPGAPPPKSGGICVYPNGNIEVRVDSLSVGHSFPSGATQDRRVWLEMKAYSSLDPMAQPVCQSGVVPEGTDPQRPAVFGFWDQALKADGTPAHFFWEVDRFEACPGGGCLLPAPTFPGEDVSRTARFTITQHCAPGTQLGDILKVTARYRVNPLPYEMLDSLIASGDLDPAIRARVKTLEIGAERQWLASDFNPVTRCNK
jgi:hypothetical protein